MRKPQGDRPAKTPRRVTVEDVAEHAGVSRATVSLVLRGSPLVAGTTRARVQDALAELGYIYNRGAAGLRDARSRMVGLVLADLNNSFFAELAAGVEHVLDDADLALFLANTSESPIRQDRVLQRMREHGADGVILCPATGSTDAVIDRLRGWNLPFVQALRHVPETSGDYVSADYAAGMEHATEHLVRLGHRRIAFVGGERVHSAFLERRTGFLAALRRHGLAEDLIVRTPHTRHAGIEIVDPLLSRDDPPTAVICFNDLVALGMLTGLADLGLEAGRDLAVVGFDDVNEAALSRPALTTVATTPWEIGQGVAHLLLRRLAEPQGPSERIILPARLVVRESCGAQQHPDRDAT